jgi:hypothetical protein
MPSSSHKAACPGSPASASAEPISSSTWLAAVHTNCLRCARSALSGSSADSRMRRPRLRCPRWAQGRFWPSSARSRAQRRQFVAYAVLYRLCGCERVLDFLSISSTAERRLGMCGGRKEEALAAAFKFAPCLPRVLNGNLYYISTYGYHHLHCQCGCLFSFRSSRRSLAAMRSIVIEPTRHPSLSGSGAFSEREDRAREPPTAT